jgi:hypothetical protein
MYEVISGFPPYHDKSHDEEIKICQGLRPRFNTKVLYLIVHLIRDWNRFPFGESILASINRD